LHFSMILPVSRQSSSKEASRTVRRGLKTRAQSGAKRSNCSLTASRMRRRIRLRTTALPMARGKVKPTWGTRFGSPVLRRQNTAKYRQLIRNPVW
jgi:hypothetical protein